MQRDNLHTAWKRVRANKGAAGIDGMSIDEFPDWARSGHWKRIVSELETGRYRPSPVRRVEINKADGGIRQLGIPTVTDRVIQQAIAQVLTPVFDPGFSDNSFGFRPGRNGQQAVKQVQSIIKEGRRIAVDVDLDHWIRRRIRMAYWRQWRKPRTKVRSLMRSGVPVRSAVACGITSKGPWRSSKTPGIQQVLSNAYLKSEGLYALRDGWIKLHHSR